MATSISETRQAEFIGFLLGGNEESVKEYMERYPEEIDPSCNNGEAIVQACSNGNQDLLKLLLNHPLVDPTVRGNAPMLLCIGWNRIGCLTELLKDGRASVEPLSRLLATRDLSLMWFLGSLTNSHLEACLDVNADAIRTMNLPRLGFEHFDILFARAKNHPEVLKALRIGMLRAIRLPENSTRDLALCNLMEKLPPMPTKRLRLFIKLRVALGLVCKDPYLTAPAFVPELANLISLQFNPDVPTVQSTREKIVQTVKRKIFPSVYFYATLFAGLLMKNSAYRWLPSDSHSTLMMAINCAVGQYFFKKHLQWVKWKSNFLNIIIVDMAGVILFFFISLLLYFMS